MVIDGIDLILEIGGKALGYSTGCKISTSTETGERITKEQTSSKFKEKYVKSLSESISADGFVATDGTEKPTYDELKALQLAGKAVTVHYAVRDEDKRTAKAAGGYTGSYIITSLELDAQAGDDAKYSISLENSGEVKLVDNATTLGYTA